MASHASKERAYDSLTLLCGECGEHLLLMGGDGWWYEVPGRTFECGGCGHRLTLGSRIVPMSERGQSSLPNGPGHR